MNTLNIWNKLVNMPAGKWLFSQVLCLKAPYFGTISPRFVELTQGYCKISFAKRRGVLNHIGTVHAIAMCNAAELAGGTMTEVTVPTTHRWIPKAMQVEYLKPAKSNLVVVAKPGGDLPLDEAGAYLVNIAITDSQSELVFKAQITMWISPKKSTAT